MGDACRFSYSVKKILMKHHFFFPTATILIAAMFPAPCRSQTPYTSGGEVTTTILGTSNIHDWEMVSRKGACTLSLRIDAAGALTGVGNVRFTVPVNSLKSEQGSQMDNNAYKAMDEENHPTIRFEAGTATLRPAASGAYGIIVDGRLSISSVTRDVTLSAMAKVNPDRSVTIEGSYPLLTTDYNVKPISVMLGAIRTSEKVTIRYVMTLKPKAEEGLPRLP
ncbi:MAG: YceI family protein [Chitinophagia bacterium]|nr:YceI family protein [Chitinophagia bacterium]